MHIPRYDIILLANNITGRTNELSGLIFNALCNKKIYDSNELVTNNSKIIKTICRFGESYGQPESVDAMINCRKAGYNAMRVNLQCTTDGTFVLWHDPYLNQYYKNVYIGSTLVEYSPENNIRISNTNYSILNQYKYGDVKYASGIPTLENILKAARMVGFDIYLECKMILTNDQISKLISMINYYGMIKNVSIAAFNKENAIKISEFKYSGRYSK